MYAGFDNQPQQPDHQTAPPTVWAARRETNGLAWAGLISSALAIVPGVTLVSGGLSVAGLVRSRRTNTGQIPSIVGLALSLLLGAVSLILVAAVALPAFNQQRATASAADSAGITRLGQASPGGYTSREGIELGTGSEQDYLDALKQSDTSDVWSEYSDDDLVEAADIICSAGDEGESMIMAGYELMQGAGFTPAEIADITANATIRYCPEHAQAAQQELDDH